MEEGYFGLVDDICLDMGIDITNGPNVLEEDVSNVGWERSGKG
jgi:hypothetical protein